jgi:hypothetical protein
MLSASKAVGVILHGKALMLSELSLARLRTIRVWYADITFITNVVGYNREDALLFLAVSRIT